MSRLLSVLLIVVFSLAAVRTLICAVCTDSMTVLQSTSGCHEHGTSSTPLGIGRADSCEHDVASELFVVKQANAGTSSTGEPPFVRRSVDVGIDRGVAVRPPDTSPQAATRQLPILRI